MKKTAKILVTGGAGFIGGHLVDGLIELGYNVDVVDDGRGNVFHQNKRAKYFVQPFDELTSINELLDENLISNKIDYVFHLAATPRVIKSIKNPIETNENNIGGTLRMLELSRVAKVKKIIFVSSSSVYGDQDTLPLQENMIPKPKSPYGLQKRTGEEYCRLYYELFGLESIVIRPFNVYGERMDMKSDYAGVMGKFITQKKEGKPLTICGDGEQTRDFTHVSDVVDCLIKAMESNIGKAEIFNCGAGNNVSVNRIAEMVGGNSINVVPRPNEPKDTLADISKAKRLLGWKPKVNIKDGISTLL